MSTGIIVAMVVAVIVIDAVDVLGRLRRNAQAADRRRLALGGQARRKLAAGFREQAQHVVRDAVLAGQLAGANHAERRDLPATSVAASLLRNAARPETVTALRDSSCATSAGKAGSTV
jgi:hypothetical protein